MEVGVGDELLFESDQWRRERGNLGRSEHKQDRFDEGIMKR